MKKYILLLFIIIPASLCLSQSWNWANSAGGWGPDIPGGATMDQNNNIYVGITSNSDPCIFNSNVFTANGISDFYIAKYDNFGNEIWVKQCGGPYWPINGNAGNDDIVALEYDPSTNSLLAFGCYVGSCNFGNLTIYASQGDDRNIYLAKFDVEGNCLWAKGMGCSASSDYWDRAFSMSVDNEGFTHVCVMLPWNGSFAGIAAEYGVNLAKFDQNGNCLWVKKIVQLDSPGSLPPLYFLYGEVVGEALYLTGYKTKSQITVDSITLYNPAYTGQLIAKFDLDGNIQWLKEIGGPSGSPSIKQLDFDLNHNIYFSASFTGEYATFGTDTIYANGSKEMYIAKYSGAGEKVWISQVNATQSVQGYGVCLGRGNSLYATGSFYGEMNLGLFNLNAISNKDIYLIKMDQEGNFIAGDNTNGGLGIYVRIDQYDQANICGALVGFGNFGNTTLIEQGTGGWGDMFVVQHAPLIVGVTEEHTKEQGNKLIIYANPNEGRCTISIPEELQNEKMLYLLVYDNNGKQIHRETIDMQAEHISINLEAYAKGIYNAVLTNGKRKYEGKIVFE